MHLKDTANDHLTRQVNGLDLELFANADAASLTATFLGFPSWPLPSLDAKGLGRSDSRR